MDFSLTTSGLLSASAAVYALPGKLWGLSLSPAAAASTLIIYDNASAASGTVLAKLVVPANSATVDIVFNQGIQAQIGIYASLSGAAADAVVYYSPT